METDDNKRVMDGPITTSMRSERPTSESIAALRKRYALFDKMTAKKPAESFDSVLASAGRQGDDMPAASSPASDDAPPSSAASQNVADDWDTFERAPAAQLGRKGPLPSGRHPDTPTPGGKGKVIIKA